MTNRIISRAAGVLVLSTISIACGGAPPGPGAPGSATLAGRVRGLEPLPDPAAPRSDVAVAVVPDQPWIDRVHSTQRVSCDFRLHNAGAARRLREIAVVVVDATGAQVSRQVLDDHGIAPAIAMIPDRALAAGGDLYLFNPFELYPAELPIKALRYRFGFEDAAGTRSFTEAVVIPREHAAATELAIPLDGNVLVAEGNGPLDPHRRIDLDSPIVKAIGMVANSARYAVDLAPVDDRGLMFSGDGTTLDQWRGYHATVRAPAAATVAFVLDGVPDNRLTPHGVEPAVDPATSDPGAAYFGNLIVLDHGHGELSLFAHLARGSFTVAVGDRVTAGQPIATIGFSGSADFVHTHYQLMTGPDPRTAEGLPIRFARFTRVLGAGAIDARDDGIQTGDIIIRAPAPSP